MTISRSTDTTKKIGWALLWIATLAVALWILDVPSGLPWYRICGGGAMLGLASWIYRKT